MSVKVREATRFLVQSGRLLDRRRLAHLLGVGSPRAVLAVVEAYRNDDGGYGTAIEPDLRSGESQPAGALQAFEVFDEAGPETSPRAGELCDWLAGISAADGGIPFSLPVGDPTGCAPFWVDGDHVTSSLHITAALTWLALRTARFDPVVANHAWLRRATAFCFERIRSAPPPEHALELKYALLFLDAATDTRPDARADLERLHAVLPADGRMNVGGGLEDEGIGPLDFAPLPDRPIRRLFDGDVVSRELDRLEAAQQADGGWPSEWVAYSPAAELEWRGWLTVRAMTILHRNGRLDLAS